MKQSFCPLTFLFAVLFVASSCTHDQLPEPMMLHCPSDTISYTSYIKSIVDKSCAYEGCHISGFASGNFSSYEGLQSVIDSDAFLKRVSEQKDMPPSYTPSGKPKELTEDELTLVRCWIEGGYLP
ncbi:MAG TPA: hypothetical protein ENJ45_05330 [Phaeodactylibacter sp.]|nr:hypothetical protein [Phaeodactylibacter sp.]